MNKIYSSLIALSLLVVPILPVKAVNILTSPIVQSIEPTTSEEYLYRGVAFFEKDDYGKAIADLTKAIQLDSQNIFAYQVRGDAYLQTKEYQKAIDDYTFALKFEVLPVTYFNRGRAYFFLDKNQEAINDFTKALELDSSASPYYYLRGLTYYYMDNYNKAISDFTSALNIEENAYAYFYRGSCYVGSEDYNKALLDLNKSIEMEKNDPRFFWLRAITYWGLNQSQEALNDAQIALNMYKENGDQDAIQQVQELIGKIRADM